MLEVYDFIFFFKRLFSSFSPPQERSGTLANKVSSLINSIKSANSGSLTLCHQIDKTFLFYLSLAFPGSFNVSVQRISGEFREFHCCRDVMVSYFIEKFPIC